MHEQVPRDASALLSVLGKRVFGAPWPSAPAGAPVHAAEEALGQTRTTQQASRRPRSS